MNLQQIDELFGAWFDEEKPPGLSYTVIIPGATPHEMVRGFRNWDRKEAVSPRTRFRIASMTKSFAAAAILALRDEGKFGLDDTLAVLLPEMAGRHSAGNATLRELLSMQSGFPTDDPWADRCTGFTDAEYERAMAPEPMAARDEEYRCQYSNLGYFYLGRCIAKFSGESLHDFISNRFLAPLGMKDTCWNIDPTKDDFARGYARHEDLLVEEPIVPCRGFGDAFAGLWSTPRDLARWTGFLSEASYSDPGHTGAPLSRASRIELQTGVAPMKPYRNKKTGRIGRSAIYGFGLYRKSCGDVWAVGHGGGFPGYGSQMCWSNEHRAAVIVCANLTYAQVYEFAYEVLEAVVSDLAPQQRAIPAVLSTRSTELIKLIEHWEDGSADSIFAPNVFLDTPRELLKKRLQSIAPELPSLAFRHSHGATGLLVRGIDTRLTFSLEPLAPNRIQLVEFTAETPP